MYCAVKISKSQKVSMGLILGGRVTIKGAVVLRGVRFVRLAKQPPQAGCVLEDLKC